MFPCGFCKIFKDTFLIEHLPTATSETATEISQGNSARDEQFSTRLAQAENLLIIVPLYVCLVSKGLLIWRFSSQVEISTRYTELKKIVIIWNISTRVEI